MSSTSARLRRIAAQSLKFGMGVVLIFTVVVAVDVCHVPRGNGNVLHSDVIMVLGQPAELDGSLRGEALERSDEAIREYNSGKAPVILFTGGAAYNANVESDAMARHALAAGVPIEAVVRERDSINTIQNIANAARIMHAHGWMSAEIISSHPHLWRASVIAQQWNRLHPELAISWVDHDSPWPPYYLATSRLQECFEEAVKCVILQMTGIGVGNRLSCDALHERARTGCRLPL